MVALSSGAESLVLNGLLCVILVVATVSNSLLLFVFYRRPALRTISNRFVINLLATNLITCWILVPAMLADNAWRWGWSDAVDDDAAEPQAQAQARAQAQPQAQVEARSAWPCSAFEGAAVGLCVACVLSVVMIGVDQYFAVIDPLRYHASIKAATSALMMVVSWTTAAVFGVLGAVSANRGCAWYACERLRTPWPLRLPDGCLLAFAGLFGAFVFVAPFAAICWIYLSICSAARQNHRRATRQGSAASCGLAAAATNGQEAALLDYAYGRRASITAQVPAQMQMQMQMQVHQEYVEFDESASSKRVQLRHSSTKGSLRSTSSSIVNSLRHRISNASMFRYREETRAARISALVIVMALFCWLPFTLVLVARATPPLLARLTLPHPVKQMGILSLSSNAVISPLIFAHRNRRIHRELCRLFGMSSGRRRAASFYVSGGRRDGAGAAAAANAADAAAAAEGEQCNRPRAAFRLPQVALETDTSRSSFSSNASTGSHHRSTSLVSVSDAAAAADDDY